MNQEFRRFVLQTLRDTRNAISPHKVIRLSDLTDKDRTKLLRLAALNIFFHPSHPSETTVNAFECLWKARKS